MDKFFDRLGDIVRSFIGEGSNSARRSDQYSGYDPDIREAWEELNDYLNDEESGENTSARQPETDSAGREHLRQDYANLEVPFGAPFVQVRSSYRKLMVAYHPDRNADDPERLRVATEISKKINVSFQRIETFEEGRTK